jgi:hypothetical protein
MADSGLFEDVMPEKKELPAGAPFPEDWLEPRTAAIVAIAPFDPNDRTSILRQRTPRRKEKRVHMLSAPSDDDTHGLDLYEGGSHEDQLDVINNLSSYFSVEGDDW